MNGKRLVFSVVLSLMIILASFTGAAAKKPFGGPETSLLAAGLEGASGSTIGPDGALYVTEGAAGRVSRVDPQSGEVTTFASGLPPAIIGIGGAIDVAFMGNTAYVLVTLVGYDVGGGDTVGIYRVDGPNSFTVIADLGDWSAMNPPDTQFDLPTGLQYALEPYHGGFLVSDGHHNRVLWVSLNGETSELIAFENTVPTGLEVRGNLIYMAEAGPLPHLPEDGRILVFKSKKPIAKVLASGAPLLVDVEFGPSRTLYALSQGIWPEGGPAGSPAMPNTGALLKVGKRGSLTVVVDGLNQPTSMEFIGNTAYVVTMGGEVWKIDKFAGRPPKGKSH